jgi:hypothetical protein
MAFLTISNNLRRNGRDSVRAHRAVLRGRDAGALVGTQTAANPPLQTLAAIGRRCHPKRTHNRCAAGSKAEGPMSLLRGAPLPFQMSYIVRDARGERRLLCDEHLEQARKTQRIRLTGMICPASDCQRCRAEKEGRRGRKGVAA